VLGSGATAAGVPAAGLSVADRWILSRLAAVTAEVDVAMDDFEFGRAAEALYHFAWHEFCDWYLELAKTPLAAGGDDAGNGAGPHSGAGAPSAAEAAATTRAVLGYVLDHLLRLLHPIMPHITDELWTALTGGESIVTADWPGQRPAAGAAAPATPKQAARSVPSGSGAVPADGGVPARAGAAPVRDLAAEAEIDALMRLVTEVRRFRSDQGLRPGREIAASFEGIGATHLAGHEQHIRALLRLAHPQAGFAPTASVPVDDIVVRLDLAGAIDTAAQRRRLEKDLAAARGEADLTGRKLANAAFTQKAPADVVASTRARFAAAQADAARIEAALAALS
jgi:valyl-tRNA synthetase